jgi:hypothetical protein
MRYDYIHEFMQTQPDAEYRGVISRMTYARQTRYKPNWIWQKRGDSKKVPDKKQPKGKGKKQPLANEAQAPVQEFDITRDSMGIAEQPFGTDEEIIQPEAEGKEQPLASESQAPVQEFDITIDSNGIAEQSFDVVEEIVQPKTKGKKQPLTSEAQEFDITMDSTGIEKIILPKTKGKGKKQNTIEPPKTAEDHAHAQEFDIIMDSTDILNEPVVSKIDDNKQAKVKKPRSKKNTTSNEDNVQLKKTKVTKQALAPESAQEFDIVLESLPQEINIDNIEKQSNKNIAESAQEIDVAEPAQEFNIVNSVDNGNIVEPTILPSPSEYKQISIKLPSRPRPNKPKADKKPVVAEEGVEEVGLIEPIKPKRVYTKKQNVEK